MYPATKKADVEHLPTHLGVQRDGGCDRGNIIAAIITIHTLMNQPNVPRLVHGPLPIPAI